MFRWLYRIGDWSRRRARDRFWDPALALGERGEDIAHRVLQEAGMTVVARNYETPSGTGELDLVAWERDTLVFVEVKTRSSTEFSLPERAVDEEKRRRLLRGATDYARRCGVEFDRLRFDTIGVVIHTPGNGERERVEVNHRRNAFRPADVTIPQQHRSARFQSAKSA